jgi:hypothetical protein
VETRETWANVRIQVTSVEVLAETVGLVRPPSLQFPFKVKTGAKEFEDLSM